MNKASRKPGLTPEHALGGYSVVADGARLDEITGLSLVATAPFNTGFPAFSKAVAKLFADNMAKGGNVPKDNVLSPCDALISASRAQLSLVPSAQNQWFLIFQTNDTSPNDASAVAAAAAMFGISAAKALALTDQSNAWIVLALSGPNSRTTLERICPIDSSAAAMPIGKTARTLIGHQGAIISRRPDIASGNSTDDSILAPCFWLLAPRSSAQSFADTITSAPPFTE